MSYINIDKTIIDSISLELQMNYLSINEMFDALNRLTINDLDDYSFKHILKFLSTREKLFTIQLVCKRWQRCVQELLAQEITTLCLGQPKFNSKWCTDPRHMTPDNVLYRNDILGNDLSIILTKYPNIKCIRISEKFDISFLLSIEPLYEKLECLILDYDCINFYNDPKFYPFGVLYIKSDNNYSQRHNNVYFGSYEPFIPHIIREKWKEFIEMVGPKLLHLKVYCDINKEMIGLLVENSPNLKEIFLYGYTNEIEFVLRKINQNLKHVELAGFPHNKFNTYNETFNTNKIMNYLAETNGQNLTQLHFGIPFSMEYLNLVGHQFPNLIKLIIDFVGIDRGIPLNGLVHKLSHLKYIELNFEFDFCDRFVVELFKNSSKSIETISLRNARFRTNALKSALKEMTQIKVLILNNICINLENGGQVENFWDFLLNLKNMSKLFLRIQYIPYIAFKYISLLENLKQIDFECLTNFEYLATFKSNCLDNFDISIEVEADKNLMSSPLILEAFKAIAKTHKINFTHVEPHLSGYRCPQRQYLSIFCGRLRRNNNKRY
jgi:hypothetical protein